MVKPTRNRQLQNITKQNRTQPQPQQYIKKGNLDKRKLYENKKADLEKNALDDATIALTSAATHGAELTLQTSNLKTLPPLMVNPIVNNALSLKVTAESGAIKFYTFNITRPYNSYLTELKIFNNVSTALAATTLTESAVTINPSPFNATFFTYSAEVASNIEVAYAVLYHSSESVITMNNGSLYGLTTDGTGEVWAVPVQLSSVNPLVYQINPSNIVVSAGSSSNTYNLAVIRERSTAVAQSIQLYDSSNNLVPLRNSVGVSVPFDQFTFTYTIDAALYSGQTLRVELVGQGANIYLVNGIQYFVPVSYEINASYPIIVKAQSTISSNVYSLYQFSIL